MDSLATIGQAPRWGNFHRRRLGHDHGRAKEVIHSDDYKLHLKS